MTAIVRVAAIEIDFNIQVSYHHQSPNRGGNTK
jgi:hypothetical protein